MDKMPTSASTTLALTLLSSSSIPAKTMPDEQDDELLCGSLKKSEARKLSIESQRWMNEHIGLQTPKNVAKAASESSHSTEEVSPEPSPMHHSAPIPIHKAAQQTLFNFNKNNKPVSPTFDGTKADAPNGSLAKADSAEKKSQLDNDDDIFDFEP